MIKSIKKSNFYKDNKHNFHEKEKNTKEIV